MEFDRRILFALLVVAAATTELAGQAAAATYVVGDSLGWTVPPSQSTYENWASQQVFRVGDVLTFNFATGAHDVVKVTEDSFDSCNAANPISLLQTGPATVTLAAVGDHYFFCDVGQHCSSGQKLSIEVIANSSTGLAPPPPLTSPGPAPLRPRLPPISPGGDTLLPPPPPSSAPTVTVGSCYTTLVLIFVSIIVVGILI